MMHTLRRAVSLPSFRTFSSAVKRFDVTPKYSGATVYNKTVYLTGQVPADDCLAPDARVQTRSVLKKIDALLAQAGSSKAALLSATCLLTHFDEDFALMNDEWTKWLPAESAPTRTTIGGVALANSAWRVEITIVAAQEKAKRAGKPLSAEHLAKLRAGRAAWASKKDAAAAT